MVRYWTKQTCIDLHYLLSRRCWRRIAHDAGGEASHPTCWIAAGTLRVPTAGRRVLVIYQTFCPYKGICSYYEIGETRTAIWTYPDAFLETSGLFTGAVHGEPSHPNRGKIWPHRYICPLSAPRSLRS
ncbi:DUF427 domain-containing protein [Paraburkholderia ginsengiterrae]|uniref:DUF427 domain-containing protein n=1 Tax=Paraburkholderia ginsengiterrae TaxID=1462993 RepID=UPI0009501BAC